MNTRGIQVSNDFMLSLHKELLTTFAKHYSLEIKTLTVFQLYGFGSYDDRRPSLKDYITEITGQWINGKYLYNKIREIEKGNSKYLKLRRDYLSLLILTAGYDNYSEYLNNSPFISSETRKLEGRNFNEPSNDVDSLYYIGYYVEDRQYYIKSKFTINKMKTASWEILYWEKSFEPTFYTYYGKCVPTGESALSFYFSKENSSLNKECFVNLFYGNKMQTKPVLLGAYCGFDRNNNPVIGKLVFEQVNTSEEQNEKVRSSEINPIFHHYLYSQRMEVDGILPHKDSDLSISLNRLEIVNFLIGSYLGFYLDKNNYLIPVSFQILNELGELKFKVNNTNFKGIGRVSRTENYLISEFSEKNSSFSQFSIQIQPLERDLFLGHMLVYSGANVLNGRVLLWKNNKELTKFMENNKEFYLNISDVDESFEDKIGQYLKN
ncbi:hypothetical protein [Aestuariivivens sediminis]|uniref:hypothetical protein n=1 Tax=Aestuariivivens sediminis TaxID=2913557 RepID=UPI001F58F12B|nr:hypothetical protein [Aestuariivivens sediminis]